jgi:hypothetical protein
MFGPAQDGGGDDLTDILGDHRVKEGLSIETTLDPG